MKVPDVLLGGNHAEIEEWRRIQAIERTRARKERESERPEGPEETQ
jgi:tRNA (guanine37-N1)-methyltransferase